MNDEEKRIIKYLNKLGVETRFISLYKNNIFINNLKFSKFSRKKEDEFHKDFPEIIVSRSKLFQKICIKVSRTIKSQIKPRSILYIPDDKSLESILTYIILEPYKRKYGIQIVDEYIKDSIKVNTNCLDDFCLNYINLMINASKIEDDFEENSIYPLIHVPHQWMVDWIKTTEISYRSSRKYEENLESEILTFLEKHIPNVQESIKQSVNYLDTYYEIKE